ncbi:glutathione S-transferase family protein [Ferrovibrio xuzhouensis]|uniref:Glutathione S-transferase family protein n=1 Tax=Ferrovibrio xuzhouensis TaxID=1576914 RepID=A0ABV7VF61_9PROT
MLTIWGRASSVNVQKVLWAADELGLAYERIDVGGPYGGNDTAEYRALNPNGVVPTLRDSAGPDGRPLTIWESHAILRYLAAAYSPTGHDASGDGLWPRDLAMRADADRWMDWVHTSLHEPARTLFWGLIRDPAGTTPAAMQKAEADAATLWTRLEAWFARDDRPFIAGSRLTIGDIPLGCQVQRWLSFPLQRPALPRLEAWHKRLTARPGYRAHVMVKMV